MGIILEISARHVPNPVLAKRMLIEEHGAGMKTIIIGPSVAQEGVNPALLGDSVYNLAIDGWKSHSTLTLLAKQNLPTLAII